MTINGVEFVELSTTPDSRGRPFTLILKVRGYRERVPFDSVRQLLSGKKVQKRLINYAKGLIWWQGDEWPRYIQFVIVETLKHAIREAKCTRN